MLSQEILDEMEVIINSFDCALYDCVFIKENETNILRISIKNNKGNTTLNLCQEVSQAISPFLDVNDKELDSYTLEVSSPGIERSIKTPKQFKLSINEKIAIKLIDKKEYTGILKEATESSFKIKLNSKEIKEFKYDEIKKAKTIFDW